MPLSRRPGPYVSRSPSSRQRGGLPQDAASAHQKCGCRTPGARFIAPWTAFVRLLLWLPRSTESSQGQRFGIAALRRPLRRSAKVASDLGDGGNSPGMDRTNLPARYQLPSAMCGSNWAFECRHATASAHVIASGFIDLAGDAKESRVFASRA